MREESTEGNLEEIIDTRALKKLAYLTVIKKYLEKELAKEKNGAATQ